jgi:uncharacterized membrane protein YhaH (DUF805 family)
MIVGGLFLIFMLAIFVPSLAVAIRRLHDTNRSGWWVLAPLAGYPVTMIGAAAESSAIAMIGSLISLGFGIAVLVFYFLDGTPGDNRYGPDPKGRGAVGETAAAY